MDVGTTITCNNIVLPIFHTCMQNNEFKSHDWSSKKNSRSDVQILVRQKLLCDTEYMTPALLCNEESFTVFISFFAVALRPNGGHNLLVLEVLYITHNDAAQSVGLLWTSDQLVAETSTWQHTTLTTDKPPCPRWDSNPRSQKASGRRPTP